VNSQLCLQVAVYGSQPVWQYYWDGYHNEDWKIISANGYQFVMESAAVNGVCAAVSSSSGDSSTIVKQPCDLGNARQIWQLG
jgi:hypothetical protein